jgi:hypothetical protein
MLQPPALPLLHSMALPLLVFSVAFHFSQPEKGCG